MFYSWLYWIGYLKNSILVLFLIWILFFKHANTTLIMLLISYEIVYNRIVKKKKLKREKPNWINFFGSDWVILFQNQKLKNLKRITQNWIEKSNAHP